MDSEKFANKKAYKLPFLIDRVSYVKQSLTTVSFIGIYSLKISQHIRERFKLKKKNVDFCLFLFSLQ